MFRSIKKLLPSFSTPEGREKIFKWFWFIATFMLILGYFIIAYIIVWRK